MNGVPVIVIVSHVGVWYLDLAWRVARGAPGETAGGQARKRCVIPR